MKNLLLLFFFCVFSTKVLASTPWLLKVQSTYVDQDTNSEVTYHGTGVLVIVEDRFFVLTASHVSQGESLQIFSNNKLLPIIGRVSRNLDDTELIEVRLNPPIEPLAEWNERDRLFEVPDSKLWFWWRFIENTRRGGFSELSLKAIQLDQNETLLIRHDLWKDSELPQTSKPFYDRFFLNNPLLNLENRNSMHWTLSGQERTTSVYLKSGTSGSPALKMFYPESFKNGGSGKDFTIALSGLASHTQRFSEFSHFTSPSVIAHLLDQYLKLKLNKKNIQKNILDETHWSLRCGLTYRSMNGFQEIATSSQIGNGSSHDGGGGLIKNSPEAESPDVFERFRISPGVTHNGHNVLAYRIKYRNQVAYLNGSLSSYKLLKEWGISLNINPIETANQITNITAERLGFYRTNFSLIDKEGNRLSYEEGKIKINIVDPQSLFGEVFSFTLDENGALIGGHKPFLPIIRIRSSDGEKDLIVDLTELFFIEPSYRRDTTQYEQTLNPKKIDFDRLINLLFDCNNKVRLFTRIQKRDSNSRGYERMIEWGTESR